MSTLTVSNVSDGTLSIPTTYVTNGSAKAWANFNQSVPSVRDSLNISSITDNAAGDYTANYTASFANANYAAKGSSARLTSTTVSAYWLFPTGSTLAYSTSATNFQSGYNPTSSTLTPLDCYLTVFSTDGELA